MKSKLYFLVLGIICSIIPLTFYGFPTLENPDRNRPGGGPKVKKISALPVIIDFESGIINILFSDDLGNVFICLDNADGVAVVNEMVNTSVQDSQSYFVASGTYMLAVTAADGSLLTAITIFIP